MQNKSFAPPLTTQVREYFMHFTFQFAKSLKGDSAKLHKMVQMSWTFVNDSLCTTLCLQWEPEIIAIAVMYLAAKLSKFEVSMIKIHYNLRMKQTILW